MATTAELQAVYDRLGSTRAVAEHIGISTAHISGYLRRHGFQVRKRGGDWTRMPGANPGKIEANRIANRAIGDPAFRARPAGVRYCHRILEAGEPKRCVIHDLKNACQTCLAEHTIESVCGGASSSWDAIFVGAGR